MTALAMPGLVLAVAACGSTTSSGTGSSSPSSAPCPGTASPASGTNITIEARDYCFDPATLNLVGGQSVTVTFVNKGTKEHDLTVGSVDVGEADAGATKTFTFTVPSGTQFFCKYHQTSNNMVGVLAVSGTGGAPPASSAPAPTPTKTSTNPYGY